jgi:hypothetical protein
VTSTEDLFRTIESLEFSATLNLASNFATFVNILAQEKPVMHLAEEMQHSEVRLAVRNRVLALANDLGDERYEHPGDSALATYLWLLAGKDPLLAHSTAGTIVELPRCWWARKMAEDVLSSESALPGGG